MNTLYDTLKITGKYAGHLVAIKKEVLVRDEWKRWNNFCIGNFKLQKVLTLLETHTVCISLATHTIPAYKNIGVKYK